MTSSDRPAAPPAWTVNPLLSRGRQKQVPAFVRLAWDEASAQDFGPWRISPKPDPAETQSTPATVIHEPSTPPLPPEPEQAAEKPGAAKLRQATPPQTKPRQEPEVDPQRIQALEKAAYARGVQDGRQQEQTATATQRQKEMELIRHLAIELRSLQQNPERFFEPLKKLAMHLAEVLVRNELQTSDKAIKALIEACISQLDADGESIVVSLSPADMKLLQEIGEGTALKLVEDPNLRPGSVKARVRDTLVQDLIEHRLEPLARKILSDPENWLQRSTLLHDVIDAMPDDSSPRSWSSKHEDIVDMPEPPDSKGPQDPKEPT